MKQFTIYNLQFTIFASFLILVALFLLLATNYKLPTAYAATLCGNPSPNPRAQGLVSTPSLSGIFGTTGGCIVDSKAAFAPFKIPTFDSLESLYYTQSKNSSKVVISDTLPTITDQTIYLKTGGLTISANPTGAGTAVIFVKGNLNINSNITYGAANSGLVFVVKGDVNIDQSVTRVDAVIISEGTICTAFDGTSCPSTNILASQLVINGSLISLNPDKPIKFRRSLSDNSQPAEIINQQPKYLILLRNLISDTVQKWSEIP